MIRKINDNAYLVVDTLSYLDKIVTYDPNVANQTISPPDIPNEPFLDDFGCV